MIGAFTCYKISLQALLNSPRHFPQCTTWSPLELNVITLVPVNESSPKFSELLLRLMILLPGVRTPSVFLGEEGASCEREVPEDFLCRGDGMSLAGLCSESFVLVLCAAESALEFFSCLFTKVTLWTCSTSKWIHLQQTRPKRNTIYSFPVISQKQLYQISSTTNGPSVDRFIWPKKQKSAHTEGEKTC